MKLGKWPPKKVKNIIKGYEEVIIDEWAERIKDLAYACANDKAREMLEQLMEMRLIGDDTIHIKIEFEFLFNDLIQIMAREKRCGP